jgi:hypothetical protein
MGVEKVIRKSTKATTTHRVGTIRLLEASLNPLETNVHGSMPAKTIRG